MFEITPTIKQITETLCYLTINIVLLAFYASLPVIANTDIDIYRGLSIAGNVFMLIGYLMIVALHFKYMYYAALGIIAAMNFGMFLLLIGMGIGAKYYENVKYNVAVAFWFIELSIDILGMQIVHKIYKLNQGEQDAKDPKQKNVENIAGNNISQPQIQ